MGPLIPTDDRLLATRIKRQLMAFLSYLMFLGPMIYAVEHGWLAFGYGGLGLYVGVALAVNLAVLAALRLGWTRHLHDPSMATAQVAIAGVLALVLGWFAQGASVITLMLFFTSFFFGVFSFSTRRYLVLSAGAVLAYGAMLLLKYDPAMRAGNAFRMEVLHFILLVIVLGWMSLLGGYIAALRSTLAHRKDALAQALARLKELASRDELTGLHNRRHLIETLEQQQERAARYDEPFALCILDLDHFKHINDTYGHGVGDDTLRGFADRVRSHMRRMDVVGRRESDSTFGRYGGEEFLLLLPYANLESSRACVERLRAALRAEPLNTSAGPLTITFSAGVARHRDGETVGALLQRADDALYRAKAAGRDRTELDG